MTDEKQPKTMEEILEDVARLKQEAAQSRPIEDRLPVGTKVVLSDAAHDFLAKSRNGTRCRPSNRIGVVQGFDSRTGRNQVKWEEPVPHVEPLAAKFLKAVG